MPIRRHSAPVQWTIALVLSVVLCACGDSGHKGDAANPGGAVVIGLTSEPNTLNPLVATSWQSHDIINLIFIKLLVEEPDFLNFGPRLAERWAFSDDSLSITFDLRPDVLWHDGEPVTAADVRYTWQLQTDGAIAWASRNIKDRIVDVEVLDAHTVTYRFATRYPYQLADANDGVVLPKHIVETIPRESFNMSEFSRSPVGCGPYRFSRWVPGQFVELERNDDYYEDGKPYLDRVVFRFVPDMTTLATQLKTGEIDCLESIPPDMLPEFERDYSDISIHHFLSRGMVFVSWNLTHDILGNRDIRRALAMAVDTKEIIGTLWNGMAEVSDSPMHPMLWAHDSDMPRIPFDPEGAKSILRDLGWHDSDGDGVLDRDGSPLEIDMSTNQGVQIRADVMTMVQEYLRRIGVKVNAQVLEWNTFIGGVVEGDFESCVLGWKIGTKADLSNFWKSTSIPPAGFNASRYASAEVDELIERAKNTLDVAEAKALWSRCQRIIYGDQPILFIAVPYELVGLNGKFCDVRPNVHGFYVNLHEWYIGENCEE